MVCGAVTKQHPGEWGGDSLSGCLRPLGLCLFYDVYNNTVSEIKTVVYHKPRWSYLYLVIWKAYAECFEELSNEGELLLCKVVMDTFRKWMYSSIVKRFFFLYSFTSSFGHRTENYHLNLQLPSAHCLAVWPACFMFWVTLAALTSTLYAAVRSWSQWKRSKNPL